MADDLEPIADWLAELRLHLVPFAYLVPHPALLPDESIRFFDVDSNWLGALFDGALSVGVQSSRDTWVQRVGGGSSPAPGRPAGEARRRTTPALRARLGLARAHGLRARGQEGPRSAALGAARDDVLLCLFDDSPDQVKLRAPHQGLHFEVEDGGAVELRSLHGTVGVDTGDDPLAVNDHLRPGGHRVLDVTSLVGAFAGKLGTPFRPADFALQMLWAPEQITFKRP